MPGSDLSLLLQIKGDNAQAKSTLADTRAEVAKLKSAFGSDLNDMNSAAKSAFSSIGEAITGSIGEHIPVLGHAAAGIKEIVEKAKSLTEEMKHGGPETKKLAEQIDGLTRSTGKSKAEIVQFLTSFSGIKDASAKNEAAFKTFGGSVDLVGNKTAKFLPQLEEAGESFTAVAGAGETAAASIASLAVPIAIAVVALVALAAGAVEVTKELIELTKESAEFQGHLADLSQQTGLTVETLSALEVSAKLVGSEIGGITQAIVNFQRKLDDAQDPLSKTAEQFRKFSIDISDTENSLRQTFAALAKMPQGFAQTNAAAEFFGARGGKQVLAIIKETNGDLDKAIERFRELGILISDDDARAAKHLNDELALLDFHFKNAQAALVRELIPALAEMTKETAEVVHSARPLISLLADLTKPAVFTASEAFKGLSLTLRLLTGDYKALAEAAKEAEEARNINPIEIPDLKPVQLPGAPTSLQSAESAVAQAEAIAAAVRRSVAAQNQALDELFQKGRLDREQQTLDVITENKKVLKADQDRIDAAIQQQVEEIKALDEAQRNRGEIVKRDTADYKARNAQIVKLQQEKLDKEAEFDRTSAALRSKAAKERADSLRNQAKNETDLLSNELDRQIKNIEAGIKQGTTIEESGLTIIEQLEQSKLDAQIASVEKQKDIGFLTVENQKDLDNQLKQLQQQKDRLGDEQANRRVERERATAQRVRDIQIANIETIVRLEQIVGQRTIDSFQALADARVITEEQAARKIRDIRLKLLNDEIEATQARLKATSSITDKDERIRAEVDLNNQLRVLKEERVSLEAETGRAIDEAQKKDLENERGYADDLKQIKDRVKEIEFDAQAEDIRLMKSHFARRKDILIAQRNLDLAEEDLRHKRETDSINQQKREVDSQIALLKVRIDAIQIGTTEEIEEYERLITELDKLKAKRGELDAQQDAENTRSATRKRRISTDANRDIKEADPFGALGINVTGIKELGRDLLGGLLSPIETLKTAFGELQDAAQSFVSSTEKSIVPLSTILEGAFSQVADAIGQTVQNYVLLGETGPAVMRKVLAQALASIAAEAAVNAIKELAVGFALLAVGNFAGAGDAFTSAGLWAAIGGVAAIAGRSVAGDLFKSKSPDTASDKSSSQPGQLNPLDLERNTGQHELTLKLVLEQHVKSNDSHIVKTIVKDYQSGGNTREVISNDGVLV